MKFTPIQRVRLVEQVASAIRDAILGGTYVEGDDLPSERRMAEQFGVNRSSVREALQRLEVQGLIELRQGGGTKVRDALASAGLSLLPHMLAPGGALDETMLRDLLEIRAMLLGWTARTAALRATPEGVQLLSERLAGVVAAREPAAAQMADWAFFEQTIVMTDNRVLALLAGGIGHVYRVQRVFFEALYREFDASHHQEAYAAIARGDADGAEVAMRAYGAATVEKMK